MGVIEELLKDNKARDIAKRICGNCYEDFFHDALLKMHELEAKGKKFKSVNGQLFYFIKVVQSVFIDSKRKNSSVFITDEIEPLEFIHEEYNEEPSHFEKALNVVSEREDLKNVFLFLNKSMTVKEIKRLTGFSEPMIYKELKKSKQEVIYEYNRISSV